jgi:DNA-directed RNA polymerase specialized sigma24 family protein
MKLVSPLTVYNFVRAKPFMRVFDDHDVIAALRAELGTSMKPAERFYLEIKPRVMEYVTSNGGSKQDGLDVLQHGMLALHHHVRSGKYRGDSSLSGYLLNICKWHWYGQLKKQGREKSMRAGIPLPAPEFFGMQRPEVYVASRDLFNQVEDGCKRLLSQAFADQKRMVDITGDKGLPDEQVAREKKFRCLSRMKEIIATTPQAERAFLAYWEGMR